MVTELRSRPRLKAAVVFACALAALAGLMFGLDIGVIAGAQQFIQKDFAVSDVTIEHIVSWMMLGAAAGAVGSAWLSTRFGRKLMLIIGALVFTLASVYCALSPTAAHLETARIILGISIGILSYTAPMYLAEIAPEHIRGSMVSLYQLMITIGVLLAYLSDTAFSYSGNWHWMLGIVAVPGVLFFGGAFALPKSPRWLMLRGRHREAEAVLLRLRSNAARAKQEQEDIANQLRIPQRGWQMFLHNSNFRRSVGLGIVLQIVQQLTGMNVVTYYAPRIFETMGFTTESQMWFTVITGLVNVLAASIAIGLVDRLGRKPMLYIGFVVMAIGLGAVGAMMHFGIATGGEQTFAVVMLLIFIIGYGMSAGPLIWILCSEVQPIQGRNFGIGCSTFTNWIANFFVGATFLTLLDVMGGAPTFWLYGGLNVVFIILTFWLVPETKGVSLEHIERNLMSGKLLRRIGR